MPDELKSIFMALVDRLDIVAAAAERRPRLSQRTLEAAMALHTRAASSD